MHGRCNDDREKVSSASMGEIVAPLAMAEPAQRYVPVESPGRRSTTALRRVMATKARRTSYRTDEPAELSSQELCGLTGRINDRRSDRSRASFDRGLHVVLPLPGVDVAGYGHA